MQIIAAPWREEAALAIAAELERSGIARCPELRA
jgi:Asp-tRNA(Asn)/Glu-tRNA(Gln) amidotransferase A subunit family amidase